MVRVAINGYGRIGRVAHRVILEKHLDEVEIVGINAGHSTDIKGWMYLLKYDTSYGTLNSKFKIQNSKIEDSERTGILKDCIGYLHINQAKIPIFPRKMQLFYRGRILMSMLSSNQPGIIQVRKSLRFILMPAQSL